MVHQQYQCVSGSPWLPSVQSAETRLYDCWNVHGIELYIVPTIEFVNSLVETDRVLWWHEGSGLLIHTGWPQSGPRNPSTLLMSMNTVGPRSIYVQEYVLRRWTVSKNCLQLLSPQVQHLISARGQRPRHTFTLLRAHVHTDIKKHEMSIIDRPIQMNKCSQCMELRFALGKLYVFH